jgi:hypothetical protein
MLPTSATPSSGQCRRSVTVTCSPSLDYPSAAKTPARESVPWTRSSRCCPRGTTARSAKSHLQIRRRRGRRRRDPSPHGPADPASDRRRHRALPRRRRPAPGVAGGPQAKRLDHPAHPDSLRELTKVVPISVTLTDGEERRIRTGYVTVSARQIQFLHIDYYPGSSESSGSQDQRTQSATDAPTGRQSRGSVAASGSTCGTSAHSR